MNERNTTCGAGNYWLNQIDKKETKTSKKFALEIKILDSTEKWIGVIADQSAGFAERAIHLTNILRRDIVQYLHLYKEDEACCNNYSKMLMEIAEVNKTFI